jgi:putative inorganic carbon (hco3(-)) transporter
LLGWGPGTYMFRYAPFQVSYDRTIISTNMADGGDAHSEYLGPLSETGLPGMLSFIAVAVLTLTTGFRLLRQLKKRGDRLLVTGVLLGLTTYLVHGFLNNFLHSDKAAVPFWGFAAILVAMDLYRKKVSGTQNPGW